MGLKTKGRQVPMSARLTYPLHNGSQSQTAMLEITDETSRMVVLELELDTEAIVALMSARTARGIAGVSTRLDRIGLTMQHGSEHRPRTEYGNQMAADHHAQKWAEVNGWTDWSAKRNNSGEWVFLGRRWVEPETAES